MRRRILVLAVSLTLAACGEDSENNEAANPPETVTVEKTETVKDPAAPKREKAPAAATAGGGGQIAVPGVVGKDHQLAQDTMQEAGLYSLKEEDATGQGRLLILDRNWTVVSQDPPAGTKVSEDTTITLRSKKDGE